MDYSIIIPIYKRLEIINFVIESIINQSYQPLEVIIVDNNTDNTVTKDLKKIIASSGEKIIFPINYIKSPKIAARLPET